MDVSYPRARYALPVGCNRFHRSVSVPPLRTWSYSTRNCFFLSKLTRGGRRSDLEANTLGPEKTLVLSSPFSRCIACIDRHHRSWFSAVKTQPCDRTFIKPTPSPTIYMLALYLASDSLVPLIGTISALCARTFVRSDIVFFLCEADSFLQPNIPSGSWRSW